MLKTRMPFALVVAAIALLATACSSNVDLSVDSNSNAGNTADGKSSSYSSHIDFNNSMSTSTTTTNGVTKRVCVQKSGGTERKMESTGDVQFDDGKITKWSPGAVIKIREKTGGQTKEAVYQGEGNEPKLFVQRDGKLQPATSADEEWADKFLRAFTVAFKSDGLVTNIASNLGAGTSDFRVKVGKQTSPTDKVESLKRRCEEKSLSTKEQIDLIDSAMDDLFDPYQKQEVLESLIKRNDFSKDAKLHLVDRLDSLYDENVRKQVERELVSL